MNRLLRKYIAVSHNPFPFGKRLSKRRCIYSRWPKSSIARSENSLKMHYHRYISFTKNNSLRIFYAENVNYIRLKVFYNTL